MISMKMSFSGLFGRLRKGDLANEVRTRTRSCLEDAVKDWVTGKQDPSLSSRVGPAALATYGFKRRSPAYVKQQIRTLGREQPYASPRWTNYGRLADALLKGDPRAILRATQWLVRNSRTPMRKLITRPGGYAISVKGGNTLKVKITLPGARILNRGGSRNEVYRKQLLDMSLGGGRDRAFIYARCQELMQTRVFGFLSGGGPGRVSGLRGLKTAFRKLGRSA